MTHPESQALLLLRESFALPDGAGQTEDLGLLADLPALFSSTAVGWPISRPEAIPVDILHSPRIGSGVPRAATAHLSDRPRIKSLALPTEFRQTRHRK